MSGTMVSDTVDRSEVSVDDLVEPEIRDALRQLEDAKQQAAGLRQRAKALETDAVAALADVLTSQHELPPALLDYLYWFCPEINVGTIAAVLQVQVGTVFSLVTPMEIGRQCGTCGRQILARSRQEFQQSRGRHPGSTCRDCIESWSRASFAQYHEQQANEAAHIRWLKSIPYAEYLQTDHWQEVRRDALKRARYRCQLCNAADKLDVHHRTYERRGEEYARDVIALCRDCHSTFHEHRGLTR